MVLEDLRMSYVYHLVSTSVRLMGFSLKIQVLAMWRGKVPLI